MRGNSGTDLNSRLQAYAQAQQILEQDLPLAPLFYRGRMVLVKPWVHGSGPGGSLLITPIDYYPGLSFLNTVWVTQH